MFLTRAIGDRAIVSVQNPVRLSEYRELQPDLAVIVPRDYSHKHPEPDDVLLLIEVADTTLAFDRGTKLPLYAAEGVGEAWLIDLQAGIVERHSNPVGGVYRQITPGRRGQTLESLAVPGLALRVDDILG